MVTLDDRTAKVIKQLLVRATHDATPPNEAANDVRKVLQLVTRSFEATTGTDADGDLSLARRARLRLEVVQELRCIARVLYRAEKARPNANRSRLIKFERIGKQYKRARDRLESKDVADWSKVESLAQANRVLAALVAGSIELSAAVAAAVARLERL